MYVPSSSDGPGDVAIPQAWTTPTTTSNPARSRRLERWDDAQAPSRLRSVGPDGNDASMVARFGSS